MERYSLAIVGAGAAGLMAACQAAKLLGPGRVALLEGGPKPGKKLLATGNGRCNLTNLHIGPSHYHGDTALAAPLFSACPAGRVRGEFEALGLRTWADPQGRVYPRGLQAAAVLGALWGACVERGVAFYGDFPVQRGRPQGGGFLLEGPEGRVLWAKKLLLACGGRAAPRLGCRAGGYGLAEGFGHTVTPLRPGLGPLICPKKRTAPLKGMRARVRAALWQQGRAVWEESGEVIFGEGTLSGILMFDLSLRLAGSGEVALDFLEEMSEKETYEYLCKLKEQRPALPVREVFSGLINLRIGQQLAKSLGFTGDRPLSSLTTGDLRRAAGAIKGWRFPVEPAAGWDNAQVTIGGVPLKEVDVGTMESKRQKGLYLAGELLNLHGDCGGYNLHWAWATGLTAGLAAGKQGRGEVC